MYTLNSDIISSLETFAGKIPDSLIKSRVEKLIEEVKPTERITYEQLETFVSFATHLPKELQNFPQSFASMVRNIANTEVREAKEDIQEPANLLDEVDDSISHVDDVNAPDNKEEPLHKLGKVEKKTRARKPIKASKGKR
jgi:hypothetical protein